jgi:AraC family L-rhamnose operon transcriptional activator RhaR/AraC family L-rhamnose operon regulatory protein RhaS
MEYMYLNYFTSDHSFPFNIQYGYHDCDLPEHFHYDFYELVIVLNGTATHIINSEESFIKKGDVFVFNEEVSHGYKDPQDFKIINIMYKPERMIDVGNDIKKSPGYQALFVLEPFYRKDHRFSNTLSLSISGLEYVAELGANIDEEYKGKRQGYQTMIYAYFMEMVVYLSRQYDIQTEHAQNNFIHLAKAVSFIEDHYLNSIKLEELADKASLSVRHFNRIFKENYRTTPIDYIIKLRLEHACFLLRKSESGITEIAAQSGFDDSNYFTRQFKKYFGITPKDYRKNFRHNIHFRISIQ